MPLSSVLILRMKWTPNASSKGDFVSKAWLTKVFHTMAALVQGWANVSIRNNPSQPHGFWFIGRRQTLLQPFWQWIQHRKGEIRLLERQKLRLDDTEPLDQAILSSSCIFVTWANALSLFFFHQPIWIGLFVTLKSRFFKGYRDALKIILYGKQKAIT